MGDGVVKIDESLEKQIEELIKKNKFLYSSKKQVVGIAVNEFLNSNSITKPTKRGRNKKDGKQKS